MKNLLRDFAVCCFDETSRVVDIAPDYIVGEVRFKHQVFWIDLELDTTGKDREFRRHWKISY